MECLGLKIPKNPLLIAIPVIGALYAGYLLLFDFTELFQFSTPPGQRWYLLSKFFGMAAVLLVGVQVFTGILSKELRLDGFHRLLGIATLSSALLHVAAFLLAVSLRGGSFSLDVLYPSFLNGYYTAMVSIGSLSFYALLLVGFAGTSGAVRHRMGRWIHRLAIFIFFAVSVHALQIGTESRSGLFQILLALEGLAIFTAIAYRWRELIIITSSKINS